MRERSSCKGNGASSDKKKKLQPENGALILPRFVCENSSSYTYTHELTEKIFFVCNMCNNRKLMTFGWCVGAPNVQITLFDLKDFNENGKIEPTSKQIIVVYSIGNVFHFHTRNTVILCSDAHCFRITLDESEDNVKLKVVDSKDEQDLAGASFIGESRHISVDGELIAVIVDAWVYIYYCFPYLKLKKRILRPGMSKRERIRGICLFGNAGKVAFIDYDLDFFLVDIETEAHNAANYEGYDCDDVILCAFKCDGNTEGVAIIFSIGLIFNSVTRSEVDLTNKLNCKELDILSAKFCDYNKCIYLYDGSTGNILIYSPIKEKIMQNIKGGRCNIFLTTDVSMNKFGDEIYFINRYNAKQLCVTQTCRGKNVSLEYIARMKLFKCFSIQQIKDQYSKLCSVVTKH